MSEPTPKSHFIRIDTHAIADALLSMRESLRSSGYNEDAAVLNRCFNRGAFSSGNEWLESVQEAIQILGDRRTLLDAEQQLELSLIEKGIDLWFENRERTGVLYDPAKHPQRTSTKRSMKWFIQRRKSDLKNRDDDSGELGSQPGQ